MENKEQYIYKDGRYIKLSSFDHGAKIEIVDALPEIGNENTIYLLKEQEESGTNEDNNLYLQYIYKDGKYTKFNEFKIRRCNIYWRFGRRYYDS